MAYEYWLRVPLTCLGCGAVIPPERTDLYISELNPVLHGGWVDPGDVLPIDGEDLAGIYTPVRAPAAQTVWRIVTSWACPESLEGQWVRIEFSPEPGRGLRFDGAASVPLTPEELEQAHYVGAFVTQWVGSLPPSAERTRMVSALGPAAPPD